MPRPAITALEFTTAKAAQARVNVSAPILRGDTRLFRFKF